MLKQKKTVLWKSTLIRTADATSSADSDLSPSRTSLCLSSICPSINSDYNSIFFFSLLRSLLIFLYLSVDVAGVSFSLLFSFSLLMFLLFADVSFSVLISLTLLRCPLCQCFLLLADVSFSVVISLAPLRFPSLCQCFLVCRCFLLSAVSFSLLMFPSLC